MRPPELPTKGNRIWVIVALLAVLLLAAVVRIGRIGALSFSVDEGLTAELAELPLNRLIPEMRRIEQLPPLYHLIMLGWARVCGTRDDAVFRMPSAVFGTAAVGAMFLLGRRLFGDATGLAAALLLAASATQIHYSQTARPYSLFVLLGLLACERFAAVVQTSGGRRSAAAVALAILTALMLYTHLYAATLVAAQACVLGVLALRARRNDAAAGAWQQWTAAARAWSAAMLAAAVMLAPWAWILVSGIGRGDIGMHPDWIPRFDRERLAELVLEYAGSWTLAVVLGLFASIGLLATLRKDCVGGWLCAAAAGCGILVPAAVSATLWPVFIPRYGEPAQAILLLAAAAGVIVVARHAAGAVRARRAAWVSVAILLILGSAALLMKEPRQRAEWRSVVEALRPLVRPGDVVVLPRSFENFVFVHYRRRGAGAEGDTVLPGIPALAYDDPGSPPINSRVRGRNVWWIADLRVAPGERPGDFQPTDHILAGTRAFRRLEIRQLIPAEGISPGPSQP